MDGLVNLGFLELAEAFVIRRQLLLLTQPRIQLLRFLRCHGHAPLCDLHRVCCCFLRCVDLVEGSQLVKPVVWAVGRKAVVTIPMCSQKAQPLDINYRLIQRAAQL